MTAASGTGLSPSDIRAHNLGLVLSQIDRAGSISRTSLARETELAAGAITLLVSELVEAGLVRDSETPATSTGGRGRPQRAVEIGGETTAVIGVQFVLDALLITAVDLAGRILLRSESTVRMPSGEPGVVADRLAAAVEAARGELLLRGITTASVVVVAPAPVLQPSEVILAAVDFGWHDVDLLAMMRARMPRVPCGIRMINDANAAAYAEFAELPPGEGGRPTDMVYLKSDTGIGGGAIVDGRLLTGVNGIAFEPGHIVVVAGGEACACGRRGCLVTVAGPEVVLRNAGLGDDRGEGGLPAALEELVRREAAGDPAARAAVDDLLGWIAIAVSNCIAILQPGVVVIGGYLAAYVERLRAVAPLSTDDLASRPGGVRPAAHGRFSALDGAVLLTRRALLADPRAMVDTISASRRGPSGYSFNT